MVRHKHADVGVAVSIPGGLITPIVRRAEEKTLSVISNEMKDLAGRATATGSSSPRNIRAARRRFPISACSASRISRRSSIRLMRRSWRSARARSGRWSRTAKSRSPMSCRSRFPPITVQSTGLWGRNSFGVQAPHRKSDEHAGVALYSPGRQGCRKWVTSPSSGLALLGHLLPAGEKRVRRRGRRPPLPSGRGWRGQSPSRVRGAGSG